MVTPASSTASSATSSNKESWSSTTSVTSIPSSFFFRATNLAKPGIPLINSSTYSGVVPILSKARINSGTSIVLPSGSRKEVMFISGTAFHNSFSCLLAKPNSVLTTSNRRSEIIKLLFGFFP